MSGTAKVVTASPRPWSVQPNRFFREQMCIMDADNNVVVQANVADPHCAANMALIVALANAENTPVQS